MLYPGSTITQCRPCPSGSTTYENDALMCRRVGFPCPSGYRETDSGDCWRCHADQRFDLKLQRCVKCPTGTGAAPGLSLWCAPCSKMMERGVSDSGCVLERWFLPEGRRDCPLGSRVAYRDSLNVPVCEKCPPGFFSAERNPSQCTPCPAGSVMPEEGAESCIPCAPYAPIVANEDRTKCVDANTGCDADQQPAVVNGQSICRSTRCGNGDNSTEAAIGRVCGPCKPHPWRNGFLRTDGDFAGECSSCPVDTLSDGLVCTTCPRGQVRTEDGRCGCRGPLALTRGVDADGNCVQCPKGTSGMPGPDGENVCTICPPGTSYYAQTDRQLLGCAEEPRCSPFSDLCTLCPPGTVSTEAGSLRCEACPEGTFSHGYGSSKCLRKGEPTARVPYNDPFGNTFEI
ncbi:hypothetical protein BWQ96_09771 [Gracilariopsis chorda]|uniref:Tyrosine-protein kinase ephrin type A/B receptor-like domain-containing protein n=1 Tax=Gracilariopsis chorda TaxID=448386 RepID=A0A2V3IES5_9FLOR|nr:hypothetical protein BWQ96_09771 [Gracilariopsis chorda]|eukprot:PXF40518.1 hypothetical protein BWQ96_09771 [Gracilariopsis chorda]